MHYPIRHHGHVRESVSFRALEAALPSQWIVRHVSERDYGVDCLVELVTRGGELHGDMIAIQLKSTTLPWSTNESGCRARSPRIKQSTVSYWMGLPVPVFLCVHDAATDGIYFSCVRDRVRSDFEAYAAQTALTFPLDCGHRLDVPSGLTAFILEYWRERRFERLAHALLDLISNRSGYLEFIESSLLCDPFLTVEPDDVARLFRLYRSTQDVTWFCRGEWDVTSFEDVVRQDRARWADEWALLHEESRDRLVRELAPAFLNALSLGTNLVLRNQEAYWRAHEPMLFECVDWRALGDEIESFRRRVDAMLCL